MDHNGHPAVQVVINGHSPSQEAYPPTMSFQNYTRPLSVDEALQYSSMSSAPVFGLGSYPRNAPTIRKMMASADASGY